MTGLVVSFVAALLQVHCPRRDLLWLRNARTGEEARILVDTAVGGLDPGEWRRANRALRSWRTGRPRTMHPRLLRLLLRIQRHFGGRRIEVVSGYRVPDDAGDLSSYHQVGRAADIRIEGVSDRQLFEFCRTLDRVGCGFYPVARSHVHIDVRARSTVWVDLSPAGRPAVYVRNPGQWLLENP
jgi:uncharacterized protein YcbK (DUF882 family)